MSLLMKCGKTKRSNYTCVSDTIDRIVPFILIAEYFVLYCKLTHAHTQSLSRVWLFKTLWTVACQASLSMGFSRQHYWSELPFPPPGDLPNPGIKPTSPASAGRFFKSKLPGKHCKLTKSLGEISSATKWVQQRNAVFDQSCSIICSHSFIRLFTFHSLS